MRIKTIDSVDWIWCLANKVRFVCDFHLDEDRDSNEAEDDREDSVDEAIARKSEVKVATDAEPGAWGIVVSGWKRENLNY